MEAKSPDFRSKSERNRPGAEPPSLKKLRRLKGKMRKGAASEERGPPFLIFVSRTDKTIKQLCGLLNDLLILREADGQKVRPTAAGTSFTEKLFHQRPY